MSISLIPFDSHIECMTIDTETTGLDPAGGDEILTLAMVLDIEGQDSPSTVHLRVIPQTTKVVDAMEAFGRAYGPFSETHTRWKLTSAADAVGYSFEGAPHTALADALATRYLYRHAESIIEGHRHPGANVKRPGAYRHI